MLGANLKGGVRGVEGGGAHLCSRCICGWVYSSPRVQTVCGGLMFAVNFVLVPSNSLYLVPSFLTLGPELDNGGWGGCWIDGGARLLLVYWIHFFLLT